MAPVRAARADRCSLGLPRQSAIGGITTAPARRKRLLLRRRSGEQLGAAQSAPAGQRDGAAPLRRQGCTTL